MKRVHTPPDRIIVVGFMGAGKTTIGRAIARKLKMRFRDLDRWIVTRHKKSIRRIFLEEGEKRFRRWEAQGLKELLKEKRLVLSTGGGVVLLGGNRKRIRKAGYVLWVKASRDRIWKRVRGQLHRPLLNRADPQETIQRLLKQREGFYQSVKDTTVRNNKRTGYVINALLKRKGWKAG